MGREGPRRELRFWKGVLPVKYKTTVADSDFSFFFAVVRGGRGGAGSLFPRRAGGRGGGEEGKKRRLFPFFSLFLESFSPEFPPLSSNSLPFSVDDAPPRGLSHPCGRRRRQLRGRGCCPRWRGTQRRQMRRRRQQQSGSLPLRRRPGTRSSRPRAREPRL